MSNDTQANAVRTQLNALDANTLPLERYCEHGGYPDATSWDVVHVGDWVRSAAGETALFTATFIETQGASCGGHSQTHHHIVEGDVSRHANGSLTVRLLERERVDEF